MSYDVWQGMYEVLAEEDMLVEPFDVRSAYSMHFLEKVYSRQE